MLKSPDGELFEIDEAVVALQSQTIAHVVEDNCADNEIPLANDTGMILAKVIEYCKNHVDDDSLSEESKEDLKKWDADFMSIEISIIYDVKLSRNRNFA